MSRPKLSVGILTYNHEKYIAAAIDGILAQKVDFAYEINIVEDCSTDTTREIIIKYKSEYPDLINLFLNEHNIGVAKSMIRLLSTLKGEYVSMLDGDDCWTSPEKVRMQIGFLDANPEYVGCGHEVAMAFEGTDQQPALWGNFRRNSDPQQVFDACHQDRLTILDIASLRCHLHPSSTIYRNVFGGQIPDGFTNKNYGEWLLSMLFAEHGDLKYFENVMSLYRVHIGGVWSRLSALQMDAWILDGVMRFNELFGRKYEREFATVVGDGRSLAKQVLKCRAPLGMYIRYSSVVEYFRPGNRDISKFVFKAIYKITNLFFVNSHRL
jgi:glycosyltransferase involved in cell wall biosynthesis